MQCYQLEENNDLEPHVFLPHEQNITMELYMPIVSVLFWPSSYCFFCCSLCLSMIFSDTSVILWDRREYWNLLSFSSGGECPVTYIIEFLIFISKDLEPWLLHYINIWLDKTREENKVRAKINFKIEVKQLTYLRIRIESILL